MLSLFRAVLRTCLQVPRLQGNIKAQLPCDHRISRDIPGTEISRPPGQKVSRNQVPKLYRQVTCSVTKEYSKRGKLPHDFFVWRQHWRPSKFGKESFQESVELFREDMAWKRARKKSLSLAKMACCLKD